MSYFVFYVKKSMRPSYEYEVRSTKQGVGEGFVRGFKWEYEADDYAEKLNDDELTREIRDAINA
jgi:hypothetical protein